MAGMEDKMHLMKRDMTALSEKISAAKTPLASDDCEEGLAELSSRLQSISADMIGSDTAEQLRGEGESLRKDFDAQLTAEATIVRKIESMEQTIRLLSRKPERDQIEVKPTTLRNDKTSSESTVECVEPRKEGSSQFQPADGASSRSRRKSLADVGKSYLGPLPLRPRSESIGRLPVNEISDESQGLREERHGAPPTHDDFTSSPKKETLTNVACSQRPKKKMLSKRRSLTNKITGLSTDPPMSGQATPLGGQKCSKRGSSKKALIDVNQMPKNGSSKNAASTTSSTSSLPTSPPEGRLDKSKTFVTETIKVKSSGDKEFTASSQGSANDSEDKRREVRKRKPRLKGHDQNAPSAEDVSSHKDEGRGALACADEITSATIDMACLGDWDCRPGMDGPKPRTEENETDHRESKQPNLERQNRRSRESQGYPPLRRHRRISSKDTTKSSSSSSSDAATVRKQSGSETHSPATSAEEHERQREGQLGQQGVVRAAVESVARTVLGAAAAAAGMGSPKFQASVDSKMSAASSSSPPHESCNDLASDLIAGTEDSAKADEKRLTRKSSKAKLAEKKQSASSELHSTEDIANQTNIKSRENGEDGDDEWKVTISSKEDVSVRRSSSGQTVVVSPKKPKTTELAKAVATKPCPKKGKGTVPEKVAKRQRSRTDLIPKPGQYPVARPPRDHKPAAKSKGSQEVMPQIVTRPDKVIMKKVSFYNCWLELSLNVHRRFQPRLLSTRSEWR